jgi:hypothetical protein
MKNTYIEMCKKENKMFLLRGENTFESMTLQEYNERHETSYTEWEEINDDYLFSCDNLQLEDVENIKFI